YGLVVGLLSLACQWGQSESHDPDILFYLDVPENLQREIDYERFKAQQIVVEFRLHSTVGLKRTIDFVSQGAVEQWVLSPEELIDHTGFESTALIELYQLSVLDNFEFGWLAFRDRNTGEVYATEPFTSELHSSLKNADALRAIELLVEDMAPDHRNGEAEYDFLIGHTHPSLFPLGTADQSATRILRQQIRRRWPRLKIREAYSVAISQSADESEYTLFLQTIRTSQSDVFGLR
ncbi:MAG: hypothetical protein AAF202_02010, partial [Pseudomonadota bacterium]